MGGDIWEAVCRRLTAGRWHSPSPPPDCCGLNPPLCVRPRLPPCSTGALLGLQVCLVPTGGGLLQAVDCPEQRDKGLAMGHECGDSVTLPRGVEVGLACLGVKSV